jgi:hypothetical protein
LRWPRGIAAGRKDIVNVPFSGPKKPRSDLKGALGGSGPLIAPKPEKTESEA